MADQNLRKLRKIEPKTVAGNPIRVLYVEDAAVIRDTIARLLELKGYKVNYAKDGKEGVDKAIKWRPHVVLMDLRMPVMDGYAAISKIKAHPRTKHMPVFVISAWSSKREREKAQKAGADDFFVKPPDLNRLTEAIDKAAAGR